MGSIVITKEGTWRAQLLCKGKYASQAFHLKTLANEWVTETERLIDIGGEPGNRIRNLRTPADLTNIHIGDLQQVGAPLRRSKRADAIL